MTIRAKIYSVEKTASWINDIGKTGQPHTRVKLGHYFTLYKKINSKWTKVLSVRPETIKLVEENTGGKCLDVGLGDDLFESATKSKSSKSKNK